MLLILIPPSQTANVSKNHSFHMRDDKRFVRDSKMRMFALHLVRIGKGTHMIPPRVPV